MNYLLLCIFACFSIAVAFPTSSCLANDHPLLVFYKRRGCKIVDDFYCSEPIECPIGCTGDDGTLYEPGSSWENGYQECRCMWDTSLGEMQVPRAPKGFKPKAVLPNFQKICQLAGCPVPKTKKLLREFESFKRDDGGECFCMPGPAPYKLDSIQFYHLLCLHAPLEPILQKKTPPPTSTLVAPSLSPSKSELINNGVIFPKLPLKPKLPPSVAPVSPISKSGDVIVPKLPFKPKLPVSPKLPHSSHRPTIPSIPSSSGASVSLNGVVVPKLPPSSPPPVDGVVVPSLPTAPKLHVQQD